MTWLLIFVIWGLIWGKVKKPETNKEEISVWFWRRTVLYKFLIVRCDFWWSNGREMRATDSRGWLCLFFLNWFFFFFLSWSHGVIYDCSPMNSAFQLAHFLRCREKNVQWQARGNNNNNNNNNRAKLKIKK